MRFEKMLLDIEVQRDFFSPGGACFVRAHLQAGRNVRRLFAWARRERVPVISTMLRVRPGRRGPMSPAPHCVDGTAGEKRISGALLRHYVNFGIRNVTDLPADVFGRYQQAIFEKRHTDIFAHARAERLFTQLQAGTFVVCGAGSAAGIVQAVVGLRMRGFKILLAADAILDLGSPDAGFAWLRMLAKGAVPLSTEEIISAAGRRAGRLLQRRGCALTG